LHFSITCFTLSLLFLSCTSNCRSASTCQDAEAQGQRAANQRPKVYYAEGVDGLSTECNDSIHTELLRVRIPGNVAMYSGMIVATYSGVIVATPVIGAKRRWQ